MEKSSRERAEGARRSAEVRLNKSRQREEEARQALNDLEKTRRAEADKTARLRGLRLAKEASDKKAAIRIAAEKLGVKAAASAAGRRAKVVA